MWSQEFPLFKLPDDTLIVLFRSYLGTRDKIAVGLVCKRFRSLSYWPSSYYLHLGGEKNKMMTINGFSYPCYKWLRCIEALLDRIVAIGEVKQELKGFDDENGNFEDLIKVLTSHIHKFKLKLLVSKSDSCIDKLYFYPPIMAQISYLDLDEKTCRSGITHSELFSLLARKPLKYLRIGWLMYDDVVKLCNTLMPDSLETLVISHPNPNWCTELAIKKGPQFEAGAVSSVTHLTLTHDFDRAQKSFPKMQHLLTKFPNLQKLVLRMSGPRFMREERILFPVLDSFFSLDLAMNVHLALCLSTCLFPALKRRLPDLDSTPGGALAWGSEHAQFAITVKSEACTPNQCRFRLCWLKQEVHWFFKWKESVNFVGVNGIFLHPCEADQFMTDIQLEYPLASLWPSVCMARQLGRFSLFNGGNEITIEARECLDDTCAVCR